MHHPITAAIIPYPKLKSRLPYFRTMQIGPHISVFLKSKVVYRNPPIKNEKKLIFYVGGENQTLIQNEQKNS